MQRLACTRRTHTSRGRTSDTPLLARSAMPGPCSAFHEPPPTPNGIDDPIKRPAPVHLFEPLLRVIQGLICVQLLQTWQSDVCHEVRPVRPGSLHWIQTRTQRHCLESSVKPGFGKQGLKLPFGWGREGEGSQGAAGRMQEPAQPSPGHTGCTATARANPQASFHKLLAPSPSTPLPTVLTNARLRVEQVVVTCSPRALASCTARWPTPPAPAWMSTRCPG